MEPRRLSWVLSVAVALTMSAGGARAEEPIRQEMLPGPPAADDMATREAPREEGSVVAWSALEPPALVEALRNGGLVLLIRHGQAAGSDRDLAPWRVTGDRRAQSNLTTAGKDRARRIGEGMRALGIPVSQVIASPYYRARDFARIAFHVRPVIAADLGPENPGQIDAYRRYLAAPPARGNLVVVGHLLVPTTAQISQLNELADGHAAVYRPDGKGGGALIALIAPTDWMHLAEAMPGG
jgi:phosphohistidine phosphatase SixA